MTEPYNPDTGKRIAQSVKGHRTIPYAEASKEPAAIARRVPQWSQMIVVRTPREASGGMRDRYAHLFETY